MPDKLLDAEDLTASNRNDPWWLRLPDDGWLPVLQHPCDFAPDVFETISLNLIKNPNINSTLLFRADVLYDSRSDEFTDEPLPQQAREEALSTYSVGNENFPEVLGFNVKRTIILRMIPRNPQLDKATLQTCLLLESIGERGDLQQNIVMYIPHCATCEELPWYHPRVKALAYLHSWDASSKTASQSQGTISLHYRLYDNDTMPMNERLMRTGQHLLTTLHKHGQGKMAGYEKRVHHDQIVSQKRLQDTYTELKQRHAIRLCNNWVEQTEPNKHVFEDLGIAAFLIELWRDMYQKVVPSSANDQVDLGDERSGFPGFVDIGCGNGVLVDVLVREGYNGWGFDARRRKTWSTFEPHVQEQLKEMILIPQPLFELYAQDSERPGSADGSFISNLTSIITKNGTKQILNQLDVPNWHNGIFSTGTFIISNHADELTPWTPLLASLSASPFLAIPCCSHNLSGARFRAPSVFNSHSADRSAPTYFAANVNLSKSIAIKTASPASNYGIEDDDEAAGETATAIATASEPNPEASKHDVDDTVINGGGHGEHSSQQAQPHYPSQKARQSHQPAETGNLKHLSPQARAKQPSAYSSLCDWVAHLSTRVGYDVEKEIQRLPSTRNVGIVGRRKRKEMALRNGAEDDDIDDDKKSIEERMKRVIGIARMEKADGKQWVGRIQGLAGGNSSGGGSPAH